MPPPGQQACKGTITLNAGAIPMKAFSTITTIALLRQEQLSVYWLVGFLARSATGTREGRTKTKNPDSAWLFTLAFFAIQGRKNDRDTECAASVRKKRVPAFWEFGRTLSTSALKHSLLANAHAAHPVDEQSATSFFNSLISCLSTSLSHALPER